SCPSTTPPPPPPPPLFPYTTLFRSRSIRRPAARASAARSDSGPAPDRATKASPARPAARETAPRAAAGPRSPPARARRPRRFVGSEEHTSELQSPYDLVCRLLLEKK